MRKVTILDDYQGVALESADWSAIADRFAIDVVREHIADDDRLVVRLAGSEVVVAMRERTAFPARLLARLPDLRLLISTGMRNASIDLAAAATHGVTVCGTTSPHSAVPELTLGMIIALTRNFLAEDANVRAGGWQRAIGPGLDQLVLGVIGLGRLGRPVAQLAQGFGMRVVAWSPNLTPERARPYGVEAVPKDELFATADVVTIHMPLSERSRGLVGAGELELMKASAYLVNTSRGPIVDEAALLSALRDRRIAGAGLDVYDVEPLPEGHRLRTMPNTLLLPHIGYVTTGTYRTWFAQVVEDLLGWLDGAPVRVLDTT